jgi:hypothetical protein
VSEQQPVDLKAVVCGLMPEVGRILREADSDEVAMLLHKGVESELAAVFAGGEWDFELHPRADCELVVFRRRATRRTDPLNLV